MSIHPDTRRLDKLQRLILSSHTGNGIGLFPYTQNSKAGLAIQDLEDYNGEGLLLDPLSDARDLRTAIDAVEELP